MSNEPEYGQTVNYPMYVPPFSPPFSQDQQDPYQVQASFQMLGSYTDSPVYAGTPCGQINLSPQQAMFPFNTYPVDNSTSDQSAPMSPQDYDRSPTAYFPTSLEQSSSHMTPSESFALHTSPPEISDIPADYSGFDNFQMDYNHNAPPPTSHPVNQGYSNTDSHPETYQTYDHGNHEMYSQAYHPTSHHSIEDTSHSDNSGMFLQPQYPASVNNQHALEGY
jgi:hypothetical protein